MKLQIAIDVMIIKKNGKECFPGLFPSYGGLECSSCHDENAGGQIACEGTCSKDSDNGFMWEL